MSSGQRILVLNPKDGALMGFVQGSIQSVVTTANLGNFPKKLLDRAKLVGIDQPDDQVK